MGDVLNWRFPIEWDDGTACELTKDDQDWLSWNEGEELTTYHVRSAHEPRGWNRGTMPRLGMTRPIMVAPDGTPDCARQPGAPRIVNTQLPLLRFGDGTAPAAGRIDKDGTRLVLTHQDGKRFGWTWPRLQPLDNRQIKLVAITPQELRAEEQAAAEQAEMEDNPLFGAF